MLLILHCFSCIIHTTVAKFRKQAEREINEEKDLMKMQMQMQFELLNPMHPMIRFPFFLQEAKFTIPDPFNTTSHGV